MEKDRTDLLVFIDLGFVLLVGFLILTDTAPRNNVILPGDVEEQSVSASELAVFNVHFNEVGRFWIENGEQSFCDLQGPELLESCMQQIVENHANSVFVLAPAGRATVQQLVIIFDMCKFNDWTCSVSN